MSRKNGAQAPMGPACLEKATTLFFVIHPKTQRPLFGPFLSAADAEFGRLAIRSPDAAVEARAVDAVDQSTHKRAVARGHTLRAFMARQGVTNE